MLKLTNLISLFWVRMKQILGVAVVVGINSAPASAVELEFLVDFSWPPPDNIDPIVHNEIGDSRYVQYFLSGYQTDSETTFNDPIQIPINASTIAYYVLHIRRDVYFGWGETADGTCERVVNIITYHVMEHIVDADHYVGFLHPNQGVFSDFSRDIYQLHLLPEESATYILDVRTHPCLAPFPQTPRAEQMFERVKAHVRGRLRQIGQYYDTPSIVKRTRARLYLAGTEAINDG